jgi:hypothetical protein
MTTSPTCFKYRYSKLPGPNHCRFLVLHPGRGKEPLLCSLVNIDQSEEKVRQYSALSYRWDVPAETQPVTEPSASIKSADPRSSGNAHDLSNRKRTDSHVAVKATKERPQKKQGADTGRFYVLRWQEKCKDAIPQLEAKTDKVYVLRVKENCKEALLHLRHPKQERVLWIDAICINQRDEEEKTAQLKLVSTVYEKAETVVLWLGKGNPKEERAMKFLEAGGRFLRHVPLARRLPYRRAADILLRPLSSMKLDSKFSFDTSY